jgi:glycine oxidase
MYPDLSRELRERTGIDNGYLVCGGIELPEPGTNAPVAYWRAEGIIFEQQDAAGLRALEPALSSDLEIGYFLPQMAQVRNPRHLKALIAACATLGVLSRPGCLVTELVRKERRIVAVQTDRERLAAGRVLLATGAWSDQLLGPHGWRPGVHPVRGQIALLDTGTPGVRPVVLDGKRYLVPRDDGRVLVGSTEENAGFDARPTAAGITGLLTFATDLMPRLGGATLERTWAGLRPGSPDGLPFLGAVPGVDGLFVAAGHFRAGLQLSPATGLVMKELLLGQVLTVPLEAFRLDRPAAPPGETAFRS